MLISSISGSVFSHVFTWYVFDIDLREDFREYHVNEPTDVICKLLMH